MSKFLVIEGRVVGGHTIKDLGLTVPYETEVTLDSERASWSRDLNYAIQNKLVEKKKVVAASEMQRTPVIRKRKPKPKVKPKPKPKPQAASKKPDQAMDEKKHRERMKAMEKENRELREMNKALMQASERLYNQQEALMSKLADFMDRPMPTPTINVQGGSVASGEAAVSKSGISSDAPTFIPSQIRSKGAKASADVEVQAASKAGTDKASKAAALLKSMRNKGAEDDDTDE